MAKKLCIVNNDFSFPELPGSLLSSGGKRTLQEQVEEFLGSGRCYLTSCGFAALYLILKVLKEANPGKTDVIIPAYTAPGLVLPIRKLGLTVVLCDVSLATFTMDTARLSRLVTDKTLAVVPVHMFGIPMDIAGLHKAIGGRAIIIEDCAQSLGSEIDGKKTGSLADISFGSFGRGKNFSVYHGGFLALRSPALQREIDAQYASLPACLFGSQLKTMVQHSVFSFITQPSLYGLSSLLTNRLKSKSEQQDFSLSAMGKMHARYAGALFGLWCRHYRKRIENGQRLHARLRDMQGIWVPEYPSRSEIAFNRFPVLVDDLNAKTKLMRELAVNGIESSSMYEAPVHCKWDLDYNPKDLPDAEYFAEHLLTLPTHGLVTEKMINTIGEVFQRILGH